jgi:hypothetical protein
MLRLLIVEDDLIRERTFRYTPGEAALSDGELPEAEKVKDRTLMCGIPQILAVAGYAVVKPREATTEAAGAEEAQP